MENKYAYKGRFEDLTFKEAVHAIKLLKSVKKIIVNDKEIIEGLAITEEQFYTYLSNNNEAPTDFHASLLTLYNITIQHVTLTSEHYDSFDDFNDEED